MSTAKINIKNIDYFKYRKLVIDGCRDDYGACSREVKLLCDAVQTLSFRDDEFDDPTDRGRLADIGSFYRQILSGKRIDPVDMRLKSGWWSDPSKTIPGYSAGKIKQTMLLEVLASKTRDFITRHNAASAQEDHFQQSNVELLERKLEGPGLYVFKHRERQCFQVVGLAPDGVFTRVAERLKSAFDGTQSSASDPLSSLIVISLASDWDFYFVPVTASDNSRMLRIIENDLVLKHDTVWPHGLNHKIHLDSTIEVSEFRRSCLRHRWPPEYDTAAKFDAQLDLERLRRDIEAAPSSDLSPSGLPLKPSTGAHQARCGAEDFGNEKPVTPLTKTSRTTSKASSGSGSDPHPTASSAKTTPSASASKTTPANRSTAVAMETSTVGNTTDTGVTSKRNNEKQASKPVATKSKNDETPSQDNSSSSSSSSQAPLKRSGTFTSLPAAVEADENGDAPVTTSGRES